MDMNGSILVIDDERAFCSFLRCVFNRDGYAVETARNGREGLALARAKEFKAIITDMLMPELDGMGMVTYLRADGIEVPVVAITAYTPFEIHLDAAATECIDQLVKKPFTAQQIRSAVDAAIRSAALRRLQALAGEEPRCLPFKNQGL
jgi:DNA-binding NtrC family response regulator